MGSDHSRGPIKDPLALQSLSDVKLERIKDKREVGINFSLKKFAPAENDGDNMLLASDLWADRCAIVIVLSRPGCPLCREQAHMLCQRVEELSQLLDFSVDDKSFNLVAIVKSRDEEDIQEFYEYFTTSVQVNNNIYGNIFFDREQGFYKKMRNLNKWQLLLPSFWKRWNAAYKRFKGSTSTDGFKLGGILVVNKEKVWYEFREENKLDSAPLEEILQAFETATSLTVDRVSLNSFNAVESRPVETSEPT